jgi:hypothetical protein
MGIPTESLDELLSDDDEGSFEWCEHVCRTSSRSLLAQQNSYSSEDFRHCYSLETHSPIDQAGVNSDRATACVHPSMVGGSNSGNGNDQEGALVSKDMKPHLHHSHILCREDEVYPIIKKPPPRAKILRDYG